MNTLRWILVLPSYIIGYLIVRVAVLFCWQFFVGTPMFGQNNLLGIIDNIIFQIGLIIDNAISIICALSIAAKVAPTKKVKVIMVLSIATCIIALFGTACALAGYSNNIVRVIVESLVVIVTCVVLIIKVKDKKDDELEKEDLV